MNTRTETIRRIRRGQVKSWVLTVVLDVALVWCAVSAAQRGHWPDFAMIVAAAVFVTGFCLWLDRVVIHFDPVGQPLTGQDADRLARWRLRIYEKHRRHCPGAADE
jgi:hypothetical protein